ncbi:MAG: GatB/YqeY domain-containing protein [Pseudomonadales bacterium]
MTEAASELKSRISDATKVAMKARDKARVATLRMVNSEIKRVEVDERRELSDDDVLTILNRMLKQRQDALTQFEQAGRNDLADQERFEMALIREFLPEPLAQAEIAALIEAAVAASGAASMKDMGKVMAELRPRIHGRADMGAVSALVKARLAG